MKHEQLESWRETVSAINDEVDVIVNNRKESYLWIADEIKDLFKKAGQPVPKVNVNSRGTVITCCWNGTSDIIVPPSLVSEINMPFSFNRKIYTNGVWMKVLIFYPFEEN